MMQWLEKTVTDQSADQDIVWKAIVQHYPMFGMHYDDIDLMVDNLLPMLRDYGFDVHFNGHEHMLNYAHTPANSTDESDNKTAGASSESIAIW